MIQQVMAEVKVLEFKLDSIRKHIENRLKIVDPIVANELKTILALISKYEDSIPVGWTLDKPLVEIKTEEDSNV